MNRLHTQTEVHPPMRVPFEGSGVIVLGDHWQSVKWQAESAKHHRAQAAAEYYGGVEMWADDVLRHLHQVGTQLDIFTKSQASVSINKKSVLKKDMASVHLAERLANMASEQELWISYPRGEGTRLPRRLCFAMHLVASPICQVCRRGLASEDYEIHNGRFTELESRWHQQ